uniref:Secreted protein n=1 Tax=Anopheles coluzzii TaxID=1518534 RepID=A0A8W7Q0Q5_ANOCL
MAPLRRRAALLLLLLPLPAAPWPERPPPLLPRLPVRLLPQLVSSLCELESVMSGSMRLHHQIARTTAPRRRCAHVAASVATLVDRLQHDELAPVVGGDVQHRLHDAKLDIGPGVADDRWGEHARQIVDRHLGRLRLGDALEVKHQEGKRVAVRRRQTLDQLTELLPHALATVGAGGARHGAAKLAQQRVRDERFAQRAQKVLDAAAQHVHVDLAERRDGFAVQELFLQRTHLPLRAGQPVQADLGQAAVFDLAHAVHDQCRDARAGRGTVIVETADGTGSLRCLRATVGRGCAGCAATSVLRLRLRYARERYLFATVRMEHGLAFAAPQTAVAEANALLALVARNRADEGTADEVVLALDDRPHGLVVLFRRPVGTFTTVAAVELDDAQLVTTAGCLCCAIVRKVDSACIGPPSGPVGTVTLACAMISPSVRGSIAFAVVLISITRFVGSCGILKLALLLYDGRCFFHDLRFACSFSGSRKSSSDCVSDRSTRNDPVELISLSTPPPPPPPVISRSSCPAWRDRRLGSVANTANCSRVSSRSVCSFRTISHTAIILRSIVSRSCSACRRAFVSVSSSLRAWNSFDSRLVMLRSALSNSRCRRLASSIDFSHCIRHSSCSWTKRRNSTSAVPSSSTSHERRSSSN